MSTILDQANPRVYEIRNAFPFRDWLQVLARSDVFHALSRQPSREHLILLCDAYMPFARSRREHAKEQGYISGADEPLVSELTDRMRSLLEVWTPPDLPKEIVEIARALLLADRSSIGIHDWEKGPDLDPGQTVDDIVVWPPWEPMRPKDPR
jgi:hypothetical protein